MSDYDRYNNSARYGMSLQGSNVFDYNHQDEDNRSLASSATTAYLRMKADLEASDAAEAARKREDEQNSMKYHISQRKLLQNARRGSHLSQSNHNGYGQARSMSPGIRAPSYAGGGGENGYGGERPRNDYRAARSMSPTPPGHGAARGGYNNNNNYGDRNNNNPSNYGGGGPDNNYASTRSHHHQQQRGRNGSANNHNNNSAAASTLQRTPSARSVSPVPHRPRSNRQLPRKSITFQHDGTYRSDMNNTTAHAQYSPPPQPEEDGRKPAAAYHRNNNHNNPHPQPQNRYREDLVSSAHSPYVPPSQRRPAAAAPQRQAPSNHSPTGSLRESSHSTPPGSLAIHKRSQRSSVSCSVNSMVSDISECRSVYGDGLPVWGNHVEDANDQGVAPSKEQQPAMMIEIQPGFSLPLRGADETSRALAVNFIVKLGCMVCTLEIQCIGDAEYILCPVCRSVSPIDGNTGNNGGVGLGLQVEC